MSDTKDDSRMKFDDVPKTEAIVWQMRLADMTRADDRNVLNRTFNGDPPFDESTAEENNIEVNRNFLEGTGNLTDARTQWNANFLKPGNIFNIRVDCPKPHDKRAYSISVTNRAMSVLKNSLPMISQARETGAGVLLHGVGPATWSDRRSPVPKVIPIGSLLIPSETDIDFENLEYFAIFREMTPSQLWERTHGPKVDPGWNMKLVDSELKYVAEQTQKQPNATAFQFMPERVSELIKQDKGFWGSDAVPTIDYWDFYFREHENGTGWYRRIFLDWSSSGREVASNTDAAPSPSPNGGQWLYNSGRQEYAKSWQEIVHVNYGDCSCVAPFKYHSVRSLGWMIWGIVDIQNRMYCKLAEQAFSDLMWFFRVASGSEFTRLMKANFLHFGVIPQGVEFIKGNERFTPNADFIQLVLQKNRELIAQHSSSFTRSTERQYADKEKTATQVMAEVNSINTLVSGVMGMAYTYEAFKYREIIRRLCLPNNPDPLARKFRDGCLRDGVPEEYLDVERMEIEPDRAMGAGNKTVQMAIVQYLNSVRQNLGPDAQRRVDHDNILVVTEDAQLAEDLSPIKGEQQVSKSMHDAQLATDRLMRGLPFMPPRDAVHEDYVQVWLQDMAAIVQGIQREDNVGTPEKLTGLQNMAQHIGQFLQVMSQNEADKPKVRQYGDALGKLMNVVKGFAQRLQEKLKSGNGGQPGVDPEAMQKLQGKMLLDQAKAANMRESHGARTAQKQVQFEMQEQRKEREHRAQLRREAEQQAIETAGEVTRNRLKSVQQ